MAPCATAVHVPVAILTKELQLLIRRSDINDILNECPTIDERRRLYELRQLVTPLYAQIPFARFDTTLDDLSCRVTVIVSSSSSHY